MQTENMIKLVDIIARFCVVCVTLIAIVHLQNWHIWCAAETNPTCKSAECQKLGAVFKKNMDETKKPCNDFYDYVCHGWPAQFPRPKYLEDWNVGDMMEAKAKEKLKNLLKAESASDSSDIKQAKALYKACLSIPHLENVDINTVKEIAKNVTTSPIFFPVIPYLPFNPSWWLIDKRFLLVTGESALFNIQFGTDGNEILPKINILESPYGILKRSFGFDKENELNHYKSYLLKLIQTIAPPAVESTTDTFKKNIDEIVKFRNELFEISVNAIAQPLEKVTVRELQSWYNGFAMKPTSKINWLEILRSTFKDGKDAYGKFITDSTKIKVNKYYLLNLIEVLGHTPKRAILNHIHLYFAEQHIELALDLKVDLEQSFNSNGLGNGRIKYKESRSMECIKNHDMRSTLTKIYSLGTLSKANKLEVRNLISEAQRLLVEQISKSTWLSTQSKKVYSEKISAIKKVIGIFDYANDSALREEFNLDPLESNAGYGKDNELIVTDTYLQSPIYNPDLPYVLQYGSLVALLAHELYHAVDTTDIKLNKNQMTYLPSAEELAKYKQQMRCFRNDFKKLELQAFPNIKKILMFESIDEDVSDVMGLKLAYNGLQQKLKQLKGVCPILPGFEKYGCQKMFFIAFANIFCSGSSHIGRLRTFLYDNHNVPEIRVNGAVGNMKEFSTVFGCKANDPMNRQPKCDLWIN